MIITDDTTEADVKEYFADKRINLDDLIFNKAGKGTDYLNCPFCGERGEAVFYCAPADVAWSSHAKCMKAMYGKLFSSNAADYATRKETTSRTRSYSEKTLMGIELEAKPQPKTPK